MNRVLSSISGQEPASLPILPCQELTRQLRIRETEMWTTTRTEVPRGPAPPTKSQPLLASDAYRSHVSRSEVNRTTLLSQVQSQGRPVGYLESIHGK